MRKWLLLVVILALILRLAAIDLMPPSLNWDEVSHGYNAYSILKTGRDEWGKSFPIIFRAYGDYKLPVYIYLTILSEAILGLSQLSVRLPSILAGTATVIFTYLLVEHLTKKKRLALLSAFLLAIEPWGLFVSRVAVEANLSVFFIISGVYFFVLGVKEKNWKLWLSALLLGLSVWTYNSARIFVPFLLVILSFIYKKELIKIWKKNKKLIAYCLLTIVLFFIPMFYQLLNPEGQARYGSVRIIDEGAITQINTARSNINLPKPLPRLIHNKVTFFTKEFLGNYFSHFSPEFLFFKGGSHYQFNLPNHGLLYLINLPFFLIGLLMLAKKFKKNRFSQLIIFWLFLGPIASSLTRDVPHTLRSLMVLPAPMIMSAVGVISSWDWLKKKRMTTMFLIIYFVVLVGSLENYLERYSAVYLKEYSWSWQYGYEEIVDFARENYDVYDKIIITKKYGEPHEFFLFYWPWEPAKYQTDPSLIRFYQSNWYWVDGFDKFYFVNDWEIPKSGRKFVLESGGTVDCAIDDCLLITSPDNYPKAWNKLKTINFLNNTPAFEIYD